LPRSACPCSRQPFMKRWGSIHLIRHGQTPRLQRRGATGEAWLI
jgi:hypothetical protein